MYPQYTPDNYFNDFSCLNLSAFVHVEATVGQCEGGYILDTVKETLYVMEEFKKRGKGKSMGICPFLHLGRRDAMEILKKHMEIAESHLVSIRLILNYEPSLYYIYKYTKI